LSSRNEVVNDNYSGTNRWQFHGRQFNLNASQYGRRLQLTLGILEDKAGGYLALGRG